MNTSIAIQVLPKEQKKENVVAIVDHVIAHIKKSGYVYEVGAFETSIEGDFEGLMQLIKECQEIAIQSGASSIMSYVKISYAPKGEVMTIAEKTTKHRL